MAGRRAPGLATYRRKRSFKDSPEPASTLRARRKRKPTHTRRFVIHLHHARNRHFDLRLQAGSVLKSWAVPKGPSRDPACKRLAVEVEDHPLDYADFEGTIPEGHYGAGTVAIWDEGSWDTSDPIKQQLAKGHLHFELEGARLHGKWSLLRTRYKGKQPQWLLIKSDDAFTVDHDVADDTPLSAWNAPHASASSSPPRRGSSVASSGSRKKTNMPSADAFGFQLARLHHKAPEGDAWLHEVKYDGYRMLAWRDHSQLRLQSRNRLGWTGKLPAIARAIGTLACKSCVLDGELVVFDDHGHSRFDLLQREFSRAGSALIRYVVFDLLWLDGVDLRGQALEARKAALGRLLESSSDALVYCDHLRGHGALAYQQACEAGLEGIIAKRADSAHQDGRDDDWRKLKCIDSDEFVIVGYTPGKGARGPLGALLLAEPRAATLRYVGRVGSGMDDAMLEHLHAILKPVRKPPQLDSPPNAAQLRGARPVWVKPERVVEVAFRGRTGDGLLRQPSCKGLRPDKAPADLRDRDQGESAMPRSAKAFGIKFTHPERVLIQQPRVTKSELADFYVSIADHLLPGLVNRPLALVRCPDGADATCFFQKHPMDGMPDAIQIGDARALRGKSEPYLFVDNIEGVLALVQMNVIEFHTWGSSVNDLEHPDRLVFDLDPDAGVPWPRVRDAARQLRERLQAVGLESFVRTTGGKGLHVVAPLEPRANWAEVKDFAHALARTLEQESPREFVSVATKNRRHNRIFIDYLRNARGATAVASCSVRARPGAAVATPLRWDELPRLRSATQYTIGNIARRWKALHDDPWRGFHDLRQALPTPSSIGQI